MKHPPLRISRLPMILLVLLAGLALTGCSSYLVKNTTNKPVRVIIRFGNTSEAQIVEPGDTWTTWSTEDSAFDVTVKDAKAYLENFDRLNSEFESIKSKAGISDAERQTQIQDFVQNVTAQFQQVETIGQCIASTCPLCIANITIGEGSVTCEIDDEFAELLKSGTDS